MEYKQASWFSAIAATVLHVMLLIVSLSKLITRSINPVFIVGVKYLMPLFALVIIFTPFRCNIVLAVGCVYASTTICPFKVPSNV
mgnify:FL=1